MGSMVVDDPVEAFCDSFGIRVGRPDQDLLRELSAAFSRLPYENLTKLVKKHTVASGPARRRQPAEVMADHLGWHAGGTCFALTALFQTVLQRLGFDCRPVLCDMGHAANAHCALVVELATGPHLVDPGYLLHTPVPIPGDRPLTTAGDAVRLVRPEPGAAVCDLFTYGRWRYRLKLDSVAQHRFLQVWDESFDWTMMNGIHVCAPADGGYQYVHNHKVCLRGSDRRENLNIRGREAHELNARFGLDPELVSQAYHLLTAARCREQQDGR